MSKVTAVCGKKPRKPKKAVQLKQKAGSRWNANILRIAYAESVTENKALKVENDIRRLADQDHKFYFETMTAHPDHILMFPSLLIVGTFTCHRLFKLFAGTPLSCFMGSSSQ